MRGMSDKPEPPKRPTDGSTKTLPRPREVSWASWLIIAGSVVVVLTAFDRIAGLHTLEARRGVEEFLAEPPGQGLGLSVERALDLIKVLAMLAGATAAATAILGYQAMQRSKSARLILAILAVPLFIGGLAAGGFMASLVAAAVVWLYLQPARDWFDGIARPTAPQVAAAAQGGPRPMVGFGRSPGDGSGGGSARSTGSTGSTATLTHAGAPPADRSQNSPPAARPAPLVWACSITWGVCGLAVLFLGAVILTMATVPEALFDELRAQDPNFAAAALSDGEIASASIVSSSILLVWCLVSIAFAVFAFQRARWARIALMASAAGSAALCLVGVLASVVLLVPLMLSVVTVVLLVRPKTVSWFRPVP